MIASDVIRDGMALELTDLDAAGGPGPALEIFWSDVSSDVTFTAHHGVEMPIEVLKRFIETAEIRLPPSN